MGTVLLLCPYYYFCRFSTFSGETANFAVGCSGLILPDSLCFGNAANLQNPVHIIGENRRYIEPFLPDVERGCQGGGSHKATLYAAGSVIACLLTFVRPARILDSMFYL